MKTIRGYLIILFLLSTGSLLSQSITGYIYGDDEGKKQPLDAAVVKWINTTKGTITDEKGKFELTLVNITDKRLVVSYAGYKTDTVDAADKQSVEVTLIPNMSTSTINVEDQKKSTHFGNYNAKTE
ncbi:MAG TPA: carboxypeptidase-like regulatory domain-containing protein, partial [Ignavibacteria bacterium]|nr:carboxypeptidase-like regulatory domain-containing protein [Ignavibacteria bacterium]